MPEEQAGPRGRRALIIDFTLLGAALAVGAVAAVAGLWLMLGGAAEGTAQHRDLGRVMGIAAIAAGALCLGWAFYTSRQGLWDRLPAWVRPVVGGLLVTVLALSFLI